MLTYDDIDNELFETLRAIEGGCTSWPDNDPRLAKLVEIDENLILYHWRAGNVFDIRLGIAGRAYMAGHDRGRETAPDPRLNTCGI